MTDGHDEIRVLLGAYVLGGLNEADRHTFEDHLATCVECRDELARSAPLAGLLRRAPQDDPALDTPEALPAADSLDRLLGQVARSRTSERRRGRAGWVAAAAVVVLGGFGLAVTPVLTEDGHGIKTVAFSTVADHTVSGHATLSPQPWGTSLAVSLSELPENGPFTLKVTSDDGAVEQAASWGSTPAAAAELSCATSFPMSELDSIEVMDSDGNMVASSPGP